MTSIVKYSEEKKRYIKSLSMDILLDFLGEITDSSCRKELNDNILNNFISGKYKNSKDNILKYGLETKKKYCKAIKGELQGVFSNSTKTKVFSTEDKAFQLLSISILLWYRSNSEIQNINLERDNNNNVDWEKSLNKLIQENKNNNVSKESIRTFYRLSPIEQDTKIEDEIDKCKGRLEIYSKKAHKEEIENKINDLTEQFKQTKDDLLEKKSLIDSLNSIIEDLQAQIKQRNEEFSQIQNKLEKEKGGNKNYDIEKVKAKFNNLIKEKDDKIEELNRNLVDYENLKQTNQKLYGENNTLNRYREFNLKDFTNKINTDEFFRSTLRHLILSDEQTYKLVIKLLNIKEELLKEADKIYEQKFIDENLELDKLKETKLQLQNEIEDLKTKYDYQENTKNNLIFMDKSSMIFKDEELFRLPSENQSVPFMFKNKDLFNREVRLVLQGKEEKYINSLINKFEKENFVIVDDEDDILAIENAQRYDFESLNVFPEYDWTSIYDWFGYFENGKFIPSKTKISDYYKFVKTENLPLGIVIFYDFNKILPEIYLESFIQSIKINKKFDLVHQNLIVNEESEMFKQIIIPKELKFVFIKSKSPNAFEIPYSMKKYEVVSD